MDTAAEWATMLDALAQQGQDGRIADRHRLLQRCMQLADTVGSRTVGCSVTETVEDGFHTPVSSNDLALELDLAQYAAGDGPCVAACRDKYAHSIDVMTTEPLYPGFTTAAVRHGVRSSLSLPLPEVRKPAALNLYAGDAAAFDSPRDRARAELLARCVARLLPDSGVLEHLPDKAQFDEALRRRRLVKQACQLLRTASGLDEVAAFDALVERSCNEQRSIFAIAGELVEAGGR